MKKRLLSILSLFACLCVVFTLASTSVSYASADQYEYSAESFEAYMDQWIQLWLAGDMDAIEANNEQYASYGLPVTYDIDEEEYESEVERAGEFKEYGEPVFTQDGDVITVAKAAVCEKRTVNFTFSWNLTTQGITWTSDVESTPGETFIKACLNTVMGMGTVFVVLIFISFIISLFILLSKSRKKKAPAKESAAETVPVTEIAASDAAASAASDDELVAVIAAAVAAYEAEAGEGYDTPADGLFVRSIRRR